MPKRARYNGNLLDANTALPGDAYGKLPEQYVILITANDVLKNGLPIYHIERVVLETGEPFGDGSHIIYVNGKKQDDTPLGRLMRDFWCKDPKDMYYPELAAENRRLKETEEGAKQMESVVDRIFVEGRKEGRMEGNISTLYDLYKDGLLSLDHVLAKVNMSEADFVNYSRLKSRASKA